MPEGTVTVADRYVLGPVIGRGGSARVHRAWDRFADRLVAVKLFRRGDPRQVARGRRECEMSAALSHPALVDVLDHGVVDDGCFVAMTLVEGPSLADVLVEGPLLAATAARIGARLAAALSVVHRNGFVHRDVKPANVLLDRAGAAHLSDFGIARALDAARETPTGEIVGTAAYMAPEQVRGSHVGPPADVYALGLVLLEAVVGHREYTGGLVESAVARLSRAPVVPDSLPDPLRPLLASMTAADPGQRPGAGTVASVLGSGEGAGSSGDGRRRERVNGSGRVVSVRDAPAGSRGG